MPSLAAAATYPPTPPPHRDEHHKRYRSTDYMRPQNWRQHKHDCTIATTPWLTLRGGARPQATTDHATICDRCGGAHHTSACPNYSQPRYTHKDAQRPTPTERRALSHSTTYRLRLINARIIRQPGDGTCLYYTLRHGAGLRITSHQLRQQLADFVSTNLDLHIHGSTYRQHIYWETNLDPQHYVRNIRQAGWGGAIELSAFSQHYHTTILVYEPAPPEAPYQFTRIAQYGSFNTTRLIRVLYSGRSHYDLLLAHMTKTTPPH